MAIEVVAEALTELLEEHNRKVGQATAASRVTNVLLLGAAMGEDVTNAVARMKVLRHLEALEAGVSTND